MLNKLSIFTFFLLGIGQLIKNNIISLIPIEIYNEFTIVFCITTFGYWVLEWVLNTFVKSFREINPPHKKMYVVKNFIKSSFLAGLCFFLYKFLDLLNGTLDLMFVKRCAVYYVMNDIIGLLLVKKLPTTTKIHHITTSLCGLLVAMKQSNNLDVLTLIVLYAVFSSMAFCVNFYLGFRVYSQDIQTKRHLSNASFWVYLLSCIVNWGFQACLAIGVIPNVPFYHTLIYFAFLYSVGKDDIILMKWLNDDHNNFKKILDNKIE
jgi:hypothetical protein